MTLPLKKEVAASYHGAIKTRRISQGPGVDIDKLTGKKKIHAFGRENLYLPGRILHITARKEKRYILLMIYYEHWDSLESAIVLHWCTDELLTIWA